jgi:RNA polymerase sigma factor (TIGR02999 family)
MNRPGGQVRAAPTGPVPLQLSQISILRWITNVFGPDPSIACGPFESSLLRPLRGGSDVDYRREMREAARNSIASKSEVKQVLEPRLSSLIEAAEKRDGPATEQLFSALYSELHQLAKRQLARRGGGISLAVTELLHEAYLDIAARNGVDFPDEGRFMGYAARVMRGLIIDYARNRQAQKRGGHFEITSLEDDVAEGTADQRELAQIGEALDKLAVVEPDLAEVVDMKFFCGFSFAEISVMRNVSERTVQRRWEKARIYLHRELRAELPL